MSRNPVWLWPLVLTACLALPALSRGDIGARQVLWAQYQEMQNRPVAAVADAPIQVRSEEQENQLAAEVCGVVDQPFAAVAEALTAPANWCELVPLNFNVKSCAHWHRDGQTLLTFYAGRKFYEAPEDAYRLDYRYRLEEQDEDYFRVTLAATEGPMGTRDYRLELEALRVEQRTFVRLRSSYRPSLVSRMATRGYLATLGRNKVGFTVVGQDEADEPVYVQGVKGVVERNAMRYYLALKAFMETRHLAPPERLEARLNSWFDLTEAYRTQLHEMERGEYLRAKRLERRNQLRLQKDLEAGGNGVARSI